MKKLITGTLLLVAMLLAFGACTGADPDPAPGGANGGGGATAPTTEIEAPASPAEIEADDDRMARHGLELVTIDGEEVLRFTDTRDISVVAWNRAPDRMPNINESYWADFIREEMLRLHNVNVDLVQVPRWEEVATMSNFFAAGMVPDVAFTFDFPTVQTFADMGGVVDLAPLLRDYMDFIPNFYEITGMTNLIWNQDQRTGNIWAFAVRHYASNLRQATFVRGDWLETLGLPRPGTLQEFEDMLIAFRDNAELLLGAEDADQMIPFRLNADVSWAGEMVATSFIPSNITDREWFITGFDDRNFNRPGTKEGFRVLNRWFNDGLIWQDFAVHDAQDPRGDDLIMLGFVGSFTGNWDYPFRPSPGIVTNLQANVGEHAHFVSVAPFLNDQGVAMHPVPHGTDRSIFLPATNNEIVASLLYLDFISRPRVYEYLMFGVEGLHHERLDNGAFVVLPFDDIPDHMYIPSLRNFDLLPTFNGFPMAPEITAATQALVFPGVDPVIVADAIETALNHAWLMPRANPRPIQAEADFGGGLNTLRDALLNQAVTAPVAQFDAVFDSGLQSYLAAGAQAIMDERAAAWAEAFGDADWIPAP